MKNIYIVAICLTAALLLSCSILDAPVSFGRPRGQEAASGYWCGSGGNEDKQLLFGGDTVVLLSAIIVSDNYDWRRDSLAGKEKCSLIYYRNMEELFRIQAGEDSEVSPDPDTHHIIGEDLFTEYSSLNETIIKRNGCDIVRYTGREYLKGLVEKDGYCYTLTQKRDGSGFCLRRDGEIVLSKDSGQICGGFQDSSYPETGALYIDSGHYCFCYISGTTGYSVIDGIERQVNINTIPERFDDIKIIDGEPHSIIQAFGYSFIQSGGSGSYLMGGRNIYAKTDDARIVVSGGTSCVSGNLAYTYDAEMRTCVWFGYDSRLVIGPSGMDVLHREGRFAALRHNADGSISTKSAGDNEAFTLTGDYYYFGRDCAGMDSSGLLYLALTPHERGLPPALLAGKRKIDIDIPGYLTGIKVL